MRSAAFVAKRMLKRVGMVGGKGRIHNLTRDQYLMGYTEINVYATTPFSRTKSHKGWFAPGAPIADGDLILDRLDGYYYLVMSLKTEGSGSVNSGAVPAYIDGTLYHANALCTVERFSAGAKDEFGRPTGAGPVVVADEVRAMVASVTLNTTEGEDQVRDKEKYKVAMQKGIDIRRQDRITTQDGDVFQVDNIDRAALPGLLMLHVSTDIR